MRKYLIVLLMLLLLVVGCDSYTANIMPDKKNMSEELLKVEIFFTDDKTLIGYVKQLGIEQQDGKVYVGGSSLNYLYNKDGQVIGAYNYQRVLYMKILQKEEAHE